jgi:hypothetical protein
MGESRLVCLECGRLFEMLPPLGLCLDCGVPVVDPDEITSPVPALLRLAKRRRERSLKTRALVLGALAGAAVGIGAIAFSPTLARLGCAAPLVASLAGLLAAWQLLPGLRRWAGPSALDRALSALAPSQPRDEPPSPSYGRWGLLALALAVLPAVAWLAQPPRYDRVMSLSHHPHPGWQASLPFYLAAMRGQAQELAPCLWPPVGSAQPAAVAVRLEIAADGRVASVTVERGDAAAGYGGCVAAVIGNWRFPATPDGAPAAMQVTFGATLDRAKQAVIVELPAKLRVLVSP